MKSIINWWKCRYYNAMAEVLMDKAKKNYDKKPGDGNVPLMIKAIWYKRRAKKLENIEPKLSQRARLTKKELDDYDSSFKPKNARCHGHKLKNP